MADFVIDILFMFDGSKKAAPRFYIYEIPFFPRFSITLSKSSATFITSIEFFVDPIVSFFSTIMDSQGTNITMIETPIPLSHMSIIKEPSEETTSLSPKKRKKT